MNIGDQYIFIVSFLFIILRIYINHKIKDDSNVVNTVKTITAINDENQSELLSSENMQDYEDSEISEEL